MIIWITRVNNWITRVNKCNFLLVCFGIQVFDSQSELLYEKVVSGSTKGEIWNEIGICVLKFLFYAHEWIKQSLYTVEIVSKNLIFSRKNKSGTPNSKIS